MIRVRDIVTMKPEYSDCYNITREDEGFVGCVQDIIWYNEDTQDGDVEVEIVDHDSDSYIGDRFTISAGHLTLKERPIERVDKAIQLLERLEDTILYDNYKEDYYEALESLYRYLEIEDIVNNGGI